MELNAAEAARAFVLQWAQGNGVEAQAELERMLDALIELDALLLALQGIPGEAAEAHRRACAADLAALSTRLAARLRVWRTLGGGFALTPPPRDGALPAWSLTTADAAPGATPDPDAAPTAIARSGVAPEVTVEDAAAVASEAALEVEPLPEELLLRLQRRFSGDLDGEAQSDASMFSDTSQSYSVTVARLQEVLGGLTLPPDEPPPDWVEELARLQQCAATIDSEWPDLPRDIQRDLLSLVAAYARHVQDRHPRAGEDPERKTLATIFGQCTAFSRAYRPGVVHGLNHQHTPRNGTWLADARVYLARLRAVAGLEDGMARPKRQPERTASTTKSDAVRIVDFLAEEGFLDAGAQTIARAVMEAAKLTRPGKERMEASKQERARTLFHQHKLRVCEHSLCHWLRARDHRDGTPIPVTARYCDVCGGSDNRREALAMAACMFERGVHRLLVVGGSDDTRTDLISNVPDTIALKLVDGVGYHTQKDARANMQWADVLAVWGATELDHKVSNLYRRPPADVISVNLVQRGVAALCREVRLRLYPDTLPGG